MSGVLADAADALRTESASHAGDLTSSLPWGCGWASPTIQFTTTLALQRRQSERVRVEADAAKNASSLSLLSSSSTRVRLEAGAAAADRFGAPCRMRFFAAAGKMVRVGLLISGQGAWLLIYAQHR